MMKKLLLFLLFSVSLIAQKTETINFKQNIKDKKGLTKSLTFIDNRQDKSIGIIDDKGELVEVKFENQDVKSHIENSFLEDNKKTGNKDIVIILEELKVYNEQDQDKEYPYAKTKIKISSFLKRNNNYYFIYRFENVIVCNPKSVAHAPKYLAEQISEIITEFIKASYSNTITSYSIPENEIHNYKGYLNKNYKAFNNSELREGVYTDFKSFYNQEPNGDYSIGKNKKGKVVRLMHKDLQTSLSEMFCYVEGGKAYKLTPVGFDEMKKDENGFYIYSSRANLFAESKTGGVLVGAVAGGIVGAVIGAAIDSGSNKNSGAVNGMGFKSTIEANIYIDSLTGAYVFQK
ncbi:hypothetical protein [Chryseobacterium sp. 3008163]|uniref:hypothetical protein n=1 Tax=Chryseobacterium sp. 3008163 TaxID=2478663 RepID=UPI0013EA9300|nr:hypothetical protein [Chryseobacterium sp. 3008163]